MRGTASIRVISRWRGIRSRRRPLAAAVTPKLEPRVVGDLPDVAVEIAEATGVAAVERLGGLPGDWGAAPPSQRDHGVDLFVRSDVMRECDAAPVRAVVG